MKTRLALPFSLLFAAAPLAAQNTTGDSAFSAQLAGIATSPSLRQSAAAFNMAARASAPTTRPKYNDFVFSQIISKRDLTRALRSMVKAAYGVGFRTLGDPDDFFHGHFIFDGKSPRPRFILWHTQERANLYHLYDPGSPKDYVNKAKRNWITWLDSDKTEDAAPYRRGRAGSAWNSRPTLRKPTARTSSSSQACWARTTRRARTSPAARRRRGG
ncbi:MAG TPA: hypothetical protein VNK24_05595 [Elusimicrobiota bacterium]|nr:hypothetical protein [Elusimicrobiota bacterium]